MKKNSIYAIILKTIALFSISTIITGIPIMGNYINKLLFVVLFAELIYSFKCTKYRVVDFICLFFMIITSIFSFLYTDSFRYDNTNMILYLPIWILLYLLFSTKKGEFSKYIEQNINFFKMVIYIWFFFVFVSLFFGSSYVGNEKAFASFSGNTFRFSPTILIISSLLMILKNKTKERKFDFLLFCTIVLSLMGGSRTYFGVQIIFIIIYLLKSIKSKVLITLLFVSAFVILLIVIPYTGIGRKIQNTTYNENSYYDEMATITSGRSIFWKYDINEFLNLPIPQQFIGNGYNFSYDTNLRYVNNAVWAHNDFINILMNYGYIGLIIYIYAFFRLYYSYTKSNSIKKNNKYLFLIAVFINSFFNMSYTYLCATISYVFILYYISYSDQQLENK